MISEHSIPWCIICHIACVVCHVSCNLVHVSCILRLSCSVHVVSCVMYQVSCTMCHNFVHDMPCDMCCTIPYDAISILPYPIIPYTILSYPTLSYPIIPRPILSYPILSCHTKSYEIPRITYLTHTHTQHVTNHTDLKINISAGL